MQGPVSALARRIGMQRMNSKLAWGQHRACLVSVEYQWITLQLTYNVHSCNAYCMVSCIHAIAISSDYIIAIIILYALHTAVVKGSWLHVNFVHNLLHELR